MDVVMFPEEVTVGDVVASDETCGEGSTSRLLRKRVIDDGGGCGYRYDGKVKTAGTAVEASAEVWYRRDETAMN